MRGNPGFRFHDNQDSLFDRDLIHKRENEDVKRNQEASLKTEAGPGQIETVFETWADWGDSEDFGGLRDDAALYPHLFDRTILTRVQKKDGDSADKRNLMEKKRIKADDTVEESKEKKNVEAEIKSIKKSLPDIKTDSSQTKSLVKFLKILFQCKKNFLFFRNPHLLGQLGKLPFLMSSSSIPGHLTVSTMADNDSP